ncbi:PREDICTED: uncharacterized protein LOC107184454 [Myotis davidii]|uniref:uncharacterized protein LOC107184454 n=1 Tax=Myotis davidii TaxID=225400 RepID=UPI000767D9AE|nr:PREDICTED: uncharacterized protein LOC107184454 [Myotis davidii]
MDFHILRLPRPQRHLCSLEPRFSTGPEFGRSNAFPKPADPEPAAGVLGIPALAARKPRPSRPSHVRHVRPGPCPPSALRAPPAAVREALRLSCCRRRRSRPLSRVSDAAPAGDIRGLLIGLAPCLSRRFRPSPAAVFGRGLPAADALEASVLVLLPSPRVLEKRPRPGNGASRFQRLIAEVLIEFCVSSMRNYRLIFCHNLKQP